MINDALQVMLFGMLGIFVVMGIVILVTTLLQKLSGRKAPQNQDDNPVE